PLERVPLLALSLLLATAVCFLFKLCLGCTSFWTNDIVGVSTVQEVVSAVLGGILVPLALLPEPLQLLARLLPVQAIYSVPLMILLGKGDGADPWWGIALQAGWIVVLWGAAALLWRAGL